MSFNSILNNPALKDHEEETRSEEWNNFVHRVGEVSSLVKDLASGDRGRAEAAQALADKYLNGKIIKDDDLELMIKSDRTVINKSAFPSVSDGAQGEVSKEAWMAEMSKDAERRFLDKQIRKEKADTFKTQAMKAFRRQEYDRALSCYNKAIEQIKDNSNLYCDRALTNIKLGNFEKVLPDCDWALRINEKSFRARLYRARAHKELDDIDNLEECTKELEEMFPQHKELITFFMKTSKEEDSEEDD
ncbi:tetratricopeptide repeat protein 12 [Plutella xylostella]|uniref:tetratricopeptide repeat protein 12 n=1 Tax=Plutella xylostella TaxID=51655 RepID=UPI002032FB72|nr:tetratricopeptide repeat protein 12 [Plutella xylostella]